MKFFTPELLEKVFSTEVLTNAEIMESMEQLWQNVCKQYLIDFDKNIRGNLSKRFLKVYENHHLFHDSLITNIQFDNQKNTVDITIQLDSKQYVLTHTRIYSFHLHLDGRGTYKNGDLMWMYDEFEQQPNGRLKHNILYYVAGTEVFSEIELVFRRILVRRV